MKSSSRKYRRNFRKRLGFEALEQRKLLAGDFASGIASAIDTGIAEQTEVQVAEIGSLEIEEVDQALQEALGEMLGDDLANSPQQEPATEAEVATEIGAADQLQSEVAENSATSDPRTLDLSDSFDGFFGTIGPQTPTETLSFTAAADGLANVVVANSFQGTDLLLTATSTDGSEIEFELLSNDAFDSISFEVNQGETYELTISSAEAGAGGQFQVTVGFEAFVDQHADQTGLESTELVFADNQAELTGKLEAAGDVDTFRATAPQSGEVTLELDELEEDSRLNLTVTVTDSAGGVIAEGSTNEFLRISFDASASEEFFVAVSGGQGQRGDYRFTLNLDPTTSAPEGDSVVVGEGLATQLPAENTDPVEAVIADNLDLDADDITSDLVEAIVGNAGNDELEFDLTADLAANDLVADVVLVDEEPTGALVEDEVSAVVDQVEDLIDDVSDDVSAIVDVIGEEISEVEGISAIEEVLDEVSDDVSAIVDEIGEEISEVDGISEIEDVLDDVSDDVSAVVDVIGEEISEVDGISEIEDVLDDASDDVSAIVDVIGEEISEVEGISEIEDVFDGVSDDVSAVVDVVGEELSEVEGISEIEDVFDGVSDDVSAIVDVVGEELSEVEGISEVEDVFDGVSDDVSSIVGAIGEELSEVEAIADIEEVFDAVSDDVSAIVDTIGEEISEIDGVSEIVDEVGDIIEDGIEDAPLDEIEEAVDQVVGELEGVLGDELEVVVADNTAGLIAVDSALADVIPTDTGVDGADLNEAVAAEIVETVEVPAAAETAAEESPGDLVVVPTEGVAELDSILGTEVGDETIDSVDADSADSDSQVAEENVETEVTEDDDRKFVWSFSSDSVDSFFESLSQAREEFHQEHRRGFGGWGRRFLRGLFRR